MIDHTLRPLRTSYPRELGRAWVDSHFARICTDNKLQKTHLGESCSVSNTITFNAGTISQVFVSLPIKKLLSLVLHFFLNTDSIIIE